MSSTGGRFRSGVAAGAVALSVGLAACSGPPTPAAPPGPDVGVEHVHGLGVDPADGVLYAATHFGLWRLPDDGEAVRVADRHQDTMGFTVVGPGAFLASGHPDFRMDPELPTRLGLIRSTDAGKTWTSVSLGGEADFHVLRARHDRIYGWDAGSGRLLSSADDGATWEVRTTLDLRDLAVDPTSPDGLLATTPQGVLRSDDGGRTWAAVAGAPPVALLAWPARNSLYGITPDGQVQHSPDGGASWAARGDVGGAAEALAVDRRNGVETLYVAVSEGTILASSDGGETVTVRYRE